MLKLKKRIKRKGFTLAEIITAVAILAMLAGFISVIFKSSIDGYRSAGANTEIMQKLRAITEQLNSDFEGLCKDGYLIVTKESKSRKIYDKIGYPLETVHMDRIYYFTTGDFQSWDRYTNENNTLTFAKSNIARVFWGHDSNSLNNDELPLSECKLARDVLLLTPNPDQNIVLPDDCNGLSFAQCKIQTDVDNLISLVEDSNERDILDNSVRIDIQSEPEDVRRLFCENIGEFKIEWSEGNFDLTGDLIWLPQGTTSLQKTWGPNAVKPKAFKFTFTLYDSKGILQGGRRFTHIVYLDN